MKIEIRCPDCRNAWLIDERSRSGEMLCPRCMARIPLGEPAAAAGPPEPALPEIAPVDTIDLEPADSVSVAPVAPAAPPVLETLAPDADAEATSDEVVCPRCKLHFLPKTDAPTDSSRWTALIVEDLDYFRRIAADALAPRFEVHTARNSDEARKVLAEVPVDLIVLDLTLDGHDGGRVLLRELDPKPCPILIFTAQDESDMYGEYWQTLTEMGADDLVIKGMKVGESLLRKALELVGAPAEEETV